MAESVPPKPPPPSLPGTPSPRDKRRRVPVAKKARRWVRAPPPPPPPPQAKELLQQVPGEDGNRPAGAAVVCAALGRRRPGLSQPRHVRTIFFEPRQEEAEGRPPPRPPHHRFLRAEGVKTWCDLCCHYIFLATQRCADCKYTCHSHCQDLVHLDCQQNGRLMECSSTYDSSTGTDDGMDAQKERETNTYLTKEAVKEKVQMYNSDVTDKLKMTLNSNGVYTGFIKVQMELCRPITVRASMNPGNHVINNNDETFYLPNGYVNTLHISSTNTVREVIEALLKKFLVADNPAKFALYKRCHKEDQVYMCRLSETEHPLYLRLVAGPRTDMLSFVLREHETGEVLWEAFSLPELQNFLRILDKEEDEQLQILKRRYAAYRHKLEETLGEVWKPG